MKAFLAQELQRASAKKEEVVNRDLWEELDLQAQRFIQIAVDVVAQILEQLSAFAVLVAVFTHAVTSSRCSTR